MEHTEKETLEYVVGLAKPEIFEVEGRRFSTDRLHEINLEEKTANSFTLRTLSSLISYLKSNFDKGEQLIVHVISPSQVKVFSPLNKEKNRDCFVQADALLPRIEFDRYHDTEDFNILLQSAFVPTENRDLVLKVVGNIKEENVSTHGDDGISQTVKAKAGVATIADVVVPNPIVLKPFRTFVEIEQPETNFVLRLKDGPRAALFEADGGAWRNEAMDGIHQYLSSALTKELETKQVVILA